MGPRRYLSPTYEERSVQAFAVTRDGQSPAYERRSARASAVARHGRSPVYEGHERTSAVTRHGRSPAYEGRSVGASAVTRHGRSPAYEGRSVGASAVTRRGRSPAYEGRSVGASAVTRRGRSPAYEGRSVGASAMTHRGRSPAYEGRSVGASEVMRRGRSPAYEGHERVSIMTRHGRSPAYEGRSVGAYAVLRRSRSPAYKGQSVGASAVTHRGRSPAYERREQASAVTRHGRSPAYEGRSVGPSAVTHRGRSPACEGRSVQASAVTPHGQLPADYDYSGHHLTELLENKLDRQATELEGLARDNKKLEASNMALRQALVDAQIEIKKRKEDILSIQEERDVQIKDLLDRIAKSETDIIAGERIKRDLHEAESEATSLIAANCDLAYGIRNASQELEKEKKLSEMKVDIDNLRQEPQKLQKTLELERGANKEKVEKMQLMEKDLVLFAKEVERLKYKVLDAERQAHAPKGRYVSQYPLYTPNLHGSLSYLDQKDRP